MTKGRERRIREAQELIRGVRDELQQGPILQAYSKQEFDIYSSRAVSECAGLSAALAALETVV